MKIYDDISAFTSANPALSNILSRTSVRSYTDTKIPDETVSAILHGAMAAPTGVNRQPWEFIVIDSPELLSALASALPYAKMAAKAPLAIMTCGNSDRFLSGDDSSLWVQDLAIASENILLATHALGLGGVYTCLYPHPDREDAARRILSIPEKFVPFNLIPIGCPARVHAPLDKWHPEHIHFNRF